MRRTLACVFALAVLATGCLGGSGSTTRRLVQVDYRDDEFGSHFWRFFPHAVDAHPGDTVDFHQTWTGEPHTVTFGTVVDDAIPKLADLEKRYGNKKLTPDEEKAARDSYERLVADVPIFDPYRDAAAQNAEQPCYLRTGKPPTDPNLACRERPKPAFDGRYAYYSSGFLPPAGPGGSDFFMKIATSTRPGSYHFYCVIHFPYMQGQLIVRPKSQKLDSRTAIAKRARSEIRALSAPLERAFRDASAGGGVRTSGDLLRGPIAGFHSGREFTTSVDAFIPKRITTNVGKSVTWTIVGAHTVSFGAPSYLPIYIRDKNGNVKRNPVVDRPAGRSPPVPGVDFTKSTYKIDGGTYDGDGFYSSGLLGSEPYSTYTLRFSKPGTYRYACLVHPPMVGSVVVSP